jgi:hypothetical protein
MLNSQYERGQSKDIRRPAGTITLSVMTLTIAALIIATLYHYAQCYYAECRVLFIVMLNDVVLNVMLNAIMLSVVARKHNHLVSINIKLAYCHTENISSLWEDCHWCKPASN